SNPLDVTVTFVPKGSLLPPIVATSTLIPSNVPGALRSVPLDVSFPGSETAASYDMTVTVTDPVTGEQLASSSVEKDGTTTPGPAAMNACES
ncbi:MAG TPA: hypothetical protein VFQ54_06925, partial [Thermomicrobiales bacterium]|nr:hypothetical protein [Thermomicrobiales bacterium]